MWWETEKNASWKNHMQYGAIRDFVNWRHAHFQYLFYNCMILHNKVSTIISSMALGDSNVSQSVGRSTTLVQTEISPQLQDAITSYRLRQFTDFYTSRSKLSCKISKDLLHGPAQNGVQPVILPILWILMIPWMWFCVKCFNNYWMDCPKIQSEH